MPAALSTVLRPLLLAAVVPSAAAPTLTPTRRPNVLYIVIDDLRVDLPVYGQRHIHAPNLAKLASHSLVFDSAYCNQPVCSPSRNSFLSGRRPSTTKIWNFHSDFRAAGPRWTTLPGHFLQHGYMTLGTGKIYHPSHPVNGDGNQSWSDAPVQFVCNDTAQVGGAGTYCCPGCSACDVAGSPGTPKPRWCGVDSPLNGSGSNSSSTLCDSTTLADALPKLRYAIANQKATGQPFFLGMGLQKPHLDFKFPKQFLDYYPKTSEIAVAKHATLQPGRPPVSVHCPYEGKQYESLWKGWGYTNPWTPMRQSSAQEMRKYYWAATSYMDHLVGILLDELEDAGLTESTLTVFHSDHGWMLGEHGDWKKFTLTELGTRVPLIIRAPWLTESAGKRTSALVELVDLLPTMSELAGLPTPTVHAGDAPLDGVSLAPLFKARPPLQLKPHVWQQYPRCPMNSSDDDHSSGLWERNLCINTPATQFPWMGYSLRDATWRYTAWFRWNGTALAPILPALDSAGVPSNGTDGFFNELFKYAPGPLVDYDSVELEELGAANPSVVAKMHATVLSLLL